MSNNDRPPLGAAFATLGLLALFTVCFLGCVIGSVIVLS